MARSASEIIAMRQQILDNVSVTFLHHPHARYKPELKILIVPHRGHRFSARVMYIDRDHLIAKMYMEAEVSADTFGAYEALLDASNELVMKVLGLGKIEGPGSGWNSGDIQCPETLRCGGAYDARGLDDD